MKRSVFTGAGFLIIAATAFGQNSAEYGGAVFQFATAGSERNMIVSVDTIGGKTVTGRPYSAVEERHSLQTLGDGTRIETSETNHLYRDEQGRTRTERKDGNITIIDPVSGFTAELDPKTRTVSKTIVMRTLARTTSATPEALKSKLAQVQGEMGQVQAQYTPASPQVTKLRAEMAQKTIEDGQTQGVQVFQYNGDFPPPPPDAQKRQSEVQFTAARPIAFAGANSPLTLRVAPDNASVENLPSQMINGTLSAGTRTTETIPIGKIGNDRTMNVVNERWYSNELQVLVKSTSSDPRFGETTYQLNNIVQSSPDPSLFSIPADYTIRK